MQLATSLLIFVSLLQSFVFAAQLRPALVDKLRQGPVHVLVRLKDRNGDTLSAIEFQKFSSRTERIEAVVQALRQITSESQQRILAFLTTETSRKELLNFQSLWITNAVIIRNADLDTILKLHEFEEIESIKEEEHIELDQPMDFHEFTPEELSVIDEGEIQWGVNRVHAPLVWKTGNTGQQIVVATVDSGVRGTHEALVSNFAGDYGWFDPQEGTLVPSDSTGHGTHTTASIVGTVRNIGVAPGAQWAACKGCHSSACSTLDLMACGQWVACPTLADGSAEDCSRAPHIVSNSWGGMPGDEWYQDIVNVYRAMGIIPIFSVGNGGPSCSTTRSPGDYENVIGVGSTTEDDQLSYFSSAGPTFRGLKIKPDVVGPGSHVFSAFNMSDSSYASMSGTSMACPHVAGVVALILSQNPDYNYDQVKQVITAGSAKDIASTMRHCGSIPEYTYPNNHVGFGLVDAARSINASGSSR